MYVSFNDIRSFTLRSGDEEIGHVHDVYVDDRDWVAQYLIAETGGWFSSNKIVLNNSGIDSVDLDNRILTTSLSKQEVENAPPASSRETVSQANDKAWMLAPPSMVYLAGSRGAVLPPSFYDEAIEMDRAVSQDPAAQKADQKRERHLRSANELVGYGIFASDGDIGSVSDLVIDPSDWRIAYLSIDTGNWLPGKLVILPPKIAKAVSWADRSISFSMTKSKIEESPALSSLAELKRSHEDSIYTHYAHPMV